MDRTTSKNYILTLFLSLATVLIVGGCASIPSAPTAPGTDVTTSASAEKASTPTAPAPNATPAAHNGEPVTAQTAASDAASKSASTATAQTNGTDAGAANKGDENTEADATDANTTDTATTTAGAQTTDQTESAPTSIWARIRAGLRLPKIDDQFTQQDEQWFVENKEFREALFDRAKLYLYYIVNEVDKRGMPMEIALLPAIESAYKPYAYSRARASGLWQFIPSTGRLYGLKRNWWYDGRRDVIASTRAALDYLQKLHDDFNGDWQLALAAYNAGEGRVMRAVEWNRRHHLPTDFVHLRRLKAETRNYVPKLMAMVNIISDPKRFGIDLPDIPNAPYFARVDTNSQVDLGVIARLTGMEIDDLHHINPGYTRRATAPNGPHHILVPVDKKDAVVAGLSELPPKDRVQWLHHRVRRGDTLYEIARHYRVTVEAIKTANHLRGTMLHIGQSLMLPISASIESTVTSRPGAKVVQTAATAARAIIHRVRRGETLSSIARRYNVLVRELAEWNFMRPNDILRLGRRLKIFINDGPQALRHDPNAIVYA